MFDEHFGLGESLLLQTDLPANTTSPDISTPGLSPSGYVTTPDGFLTDSFNTPVTVTSPAYSTQNTPPFPQNNIGEFDFLDNFVWEDPIVPTVQPITSTAIPQLYSPVSVAQAGSPVLPPSNLANLPAPAPRGPQYTPSDSDSSRQVSTTPSRQVSAAPSSAPRKRKRVSETPSLEVAPRPLVPVEPEDGDDEHVVKRKRNTAAARRYRQKKQDRMAELEEKLEDMTAEKEKHKEESMHWKMEAQKYKEMFEMVMRKQQ